MVNRSNCDKEMTEIGIETEGDREREKETAKERKKRDLESEEYPQSVGQSDM